jgi:hypothetical protein
MIVTAYDVYQKDILCCRYVLTIIYLEFLYAFLVLKYRNYFDSCNIIIAIKKIK